MEAAEPNFIEELQRNGHDVTQWVREHESQCLLKVDDVFMHGEDAKDLAFGRTTLEKIIASYGGKKIPPSSFGQVSEEGEPYGLIPR